MDTTNRELQSCSSTTWDHFWLGLPWVLSGFAFASGHFFWNYPCFRRTGEAERKQTTKYMRKMRKKLYPPSNMETTADFRKYHITVLSQKITGSKDQKWDLEAHLRMKNADLREQRPPEQTEHTWAESTPSTPRPANARESMTPPRPVGVVPTAFKFPSGSRHDIAAAVEVGSDPESHLPARKCSRGGGVLLRLCSLLASVEVVVESLS